jgi:putative ABC transport system permease protein
VAVLTMRPLWRRAPTVLVRYPALFASVVVGSLLLTVALAAPPVFVSASAGRLVEGAIDAPTTTRYGAGLRYEAGPLEADVRGAEEAPEPWYVGANRTFERQAEGHPLLGDPIFTIVGPAVSAAPREDRSDVEQVRLFARTGAVEHVRRLRGTDGDGVWVPDIIADDLRLDPGDTLVLSIGPLALQTSVDGVYRALSREDRGFGEGYWRSSADEIYPEPTFGAEVPPPLVLMDEGSLLEALRGLQEDSVVFRWEAPVATSQLSLEEAQNLAGYAAEAGRTMSAESRRLRDVLFTINSRTEFVSFMGSVVDEVEERLASVTGPLAVLRVAGILIAMAVLAGAGAYGVAARRVEAALLFSRGVRPASVGLKAAAEAVVPTVVGAVLGFGAGLAAVLLLGPPGAVNPASIRASVGAAALGVPAALVLFGIASAVAYLRHSEHHVSRMRLAAALPWEVALIAVAAFIGDRLGLAEAVTGEPGEGSELSGLLVAFLVVALSGAALLAGRLVRGALRAARARGGGTSPARYLAVRELLGAPALSLFLFAASAVCLGLFVHGQAVSRSLQESVEAKASLFVGSDVSGSFNSSLVAPDEFPLPVTKVTRLAFAGTLRPGGGPFDLLAIEPATFSRAAYWEPRFSDEPLDELVAGVARPGEAIPAVLVAPEDASPPALASVFRRNLPITVVGRAEAFPGMVSTRPMLVVDVDRIRASFPDTGSPLGHADATTELWVRGPTDRAAAALAFGRQAPYLTITADQVRDIPSFEAALETLRVVNLLGVVGAVLVIAGMLMYVQARRRARIVSYALSRRMGLTDAGHRRTLLLELGGTLLGSYLVGGLLAMGATWVLVRHLDPLATVPPDPLLVLPTVVLVVAAALLAVVAVVSAVLINRRDRATNVAEVMRVAE